MTSVYVLSGFSVTVPVPLDWSTRFPVCFHVFPPCCSATVHVSGGTLAVYKPVLSVGTVMVPEALDTLTSQFGSTASPASNLPLALASYYFDPEMLCPPGPRSAAVKASPREKYDDAPLASA